MTKILLKQLKEFSPYIYHLANSGSVYLKFADERLGSLRLSDHEGRKKYRYRWNVRWDIMESFSEFDRGVTRYYYTVWETDNLVEQMRRFQDELNGELY